MPKVAIVGDGPLAGVLSKALNHVNSPRDAEVVIFTSSRVTADDVKAAADCVIVDAADPPAEADAGNGRRTRQA